MQTILKALSERDLLPLVDEICRRHHVSRADLAGRSRTRLVSHARHELWWRLMSHPEMRFSYLEIGRLFERHHTTVLHGVRAYRHHIENAPTQSIAPAAVAA